MSKEPPTIKRRHLKTIKNGTTIGIIGRRASGKTTMIKTLLYYLSPGVRIPMVVSSTSTLKRDYDKMVPPLLISEEYNPKRLRRFIEFQAKAFKDRTNVKRMKNKKKYGVLVMDDVVAQASKWKGDESFIRMILEGRHFNITNILAVHDVLDIPSNIRSNIDYIIITSEKRPKRIRSIYDQFWPHEHGTFETFSSVLKLSTEKNKCLFLDIQSASKDSNFESVVFWCRAVDPKYLPEKKIGLRSLWKINKLLYNKYWAADKYSNNRKKGENKNSAEEIILID